MDLKCYDRENRSHYSFIHMGGRTVLELRDLEYFLMIVREGSLTGAARALHLSQPGITRSLKSLEDELGKKLVVRGSRSVILTEEGRLLRRRAEELLALAGRAKSEIMHSDEVIEGDIYICAGETHGLHFLTQRASTFQKSYPGVCFHISSGDRTDVTEELEKGLTDFGLMLEPIDATKFDAIPVEYEDVWGVIMKRSDPMAGQAAVSPQELIGKPLILPRGGDYKNFGSRVLGLKPEEIYVAATYSLLFNAALMAADGIGYVIGLENIMELSEQSGLCFRPLDPPVTGRMHIVWKRNLAMSPQARAFLKVLKGQDL